MNAGPDPSVGSPQPRRGPLWAAFAVVLLLTAALVFVQRQRMGLASAPPPPLLGEVPAFSLTNRDGRTITRESLLGHPWLADLIFTRCASSCPLMTERLAKVGKDLPGLRRVSVSIDAAHDTPQALAAYAAAHGATAADWLFLTGDSDTLHTLARDGFKLPVDLAPPPGTSTEPILHSTRFVLVDAEGRIRGYYDAFDEESMTKLGQDVRALS